jgi:hypothetical protein
MTSGSVTATYDLLLTAIDLTRACCANDDYLPWLSHYSDAFHGSAGIANYVANAAALREAKADSSSCPFTVSITRATTSASRANQVKKNTHANASARKPDFFRGWISCSPARNL